MTFPPKVWDDVLRRVRGELPAHSIEAWLLPLVPETGARDELVLLCPTAFHRDRVRDHFLDILSVSLRQEVGGHARVTLGLSHRGGATPELQRSGRCSTDISRR